jgi:hypothetical protein
MRPVTDLNTLTRFSTHNLSIAVSATDTRPGL